MKFWEFGKTVGVWKNGKNNKKCQEYLRVWVGFFFRKKDIANDNIFILMESKCECWFFSECFISVIINFIYLVTALNKLYVKALNGLIY